MQEGGAHAAAAARPAAAVVITSSSSSSMIARFLLTFTPLPPPPPLAPAAPPALGGCGALPPLGGAGGAPWGAYRLLRLGRRRAAQARIHSLQQVIWGVAQIPPLHLGGDWGDALSVGAARRAQHGWPDTDGRQGILLLLLRCDEIIVLMCTVHTTAPHAHLNSSNGEPAAHTLDALGSCMQAKAPYERSCVGALLSSCAAHVSYKVGTRISQSKFKTRATCSERWQPKNDGGF